VENHKKGREDNYGRPIDFLSQISKLSHFNLLDLADFYCITSLPFDVAILGVHQCSCVPGLAFAI